MFTLETITIERGEASLTISEASAAMRMRQIEIVTEKHEDEKTGDAYLRAFEYSFVKATLVASVGFDDGLSFAEYLSMPDEMAARAFNAVQKLNPHWFDTPEQEAEKKEQA